MRRNLQATEPILIFDYPNSRDAASFRPTPGRSRNGIGATSVTTSTLTIGACSRANRFIVRCYVAENRTDQLHEAFGRPGMPPVDFEFEERRGYRLFNLKQGMVLA